jgi:hypothetical protein
MNYVPGTAVESGGGVVVSKEKIGLRLPCKTSTPVYGVLRAEDGTPITVTGVLEPTTRSVEPPESSCGFVLYLET